MELQWTKNGELIMPSQETLDALDAMTRERFAPVAAAACDLETAEHDLQTATDRVAEGVEALDHAQKVLDRMPKMTFHDLWRSTTSRPDKLR